jgi:hypothetical protein
MSYAGGSLFVGDSTICTILMNGGSAVGEVNPNYKLEVVNSSYAANVIISPS